MSLQLAPSSVAVTTGRKSCVVARASKDVNRRATIGTIATIGAVVASSTPALAKYGDPARVFKKVKPGDYIKYEGNGYSLQVPSQWEPSPQELQDDPNQDIRYEDHFDVVTTLMVSKEKSGKNSIKDCGSITDFLNSKLYLLGEQSYDGASDSEGGFKTGQYSKAVVLSADENKDSNGNPVYDYELLSTTADGNEGGRHFLIRAGAKGGFTYLLKIQSGDKRWIKGQRRNAFGSLSSFALA